MVNKLIKPILYVFQFAVFLSAGKVVVKALGPVFYGTASSFLSGFSHVRNEGGALALVTDRPADTMFRHPLRQDVSHEP